jgi:uncharacterized protein
MPHIDGNPPGVFSWVELSTTDQSAAKSFYASLFGWVALDHPMGPGDFYTMFQLEGRNAAAAYTMREDERSQGIPPHWLLYVAVESADAAASRAAELGGKVLAPPFDVMDAGRMAVMQDPTGAVVSVWQANRHQGLGITGVDGTLCWADLNTPDPPRAGKFYADLFGWKLEVTQRDSSGYLHIKSGDQFIGGIPPLSLQTPGLPPHWLLYFQVADVDATAAKAESSGAKFRVPPITLEGVGRFAVMADPQGAVSAIFTPAAHG